MSTSIGSAHAAPGSRRGPSPCEYAYDATGLLARITNPGQTGTRFWRGNRVVNELRTSASGSSQLTWLRAVGQPIVEQLSGAVSRTTLLATAISGSVLLEVDSAVRTVAYAPHGSRPDGDEAGSAKAEPGFNGEPLDAASGCYLLGAGHHRPYSPTLGMFLAPDSASPFGAGGLNGLSYCAGDPVNRTDPTGHFWKWIFAGIAVVAAVATLGVMAFAGVAALSASAVVGAAAITVGAGLEVASAVVTDEKLSMILGIAGAVLGVAGGVAAGAAIAKGAANIKAKVAKFGQRLGSVRSQRASSTVMRNQSIELPAMSPARARRAAVTRMRNGMGTDNLNPMANTSRRGSTSSVDSISSIALEPVNFNRGRRGGIYVPRQEFDPQGPGWVALDRGKSPAWTSGGVTIDSGGVSATLNVDEHLRIGQLGGPDLGNGLDEAWALINDPPPIYRLVSSPRHASARPPSYASPSYAPHEFF